MGNQQRKQIISPPFKKEQWNYVHDRSDMHQEYGYYRTLQNKITGDKIDQYQFIWQDVEELNYYIQSFNWRWNQPHIVSTRYIQIGNKNQFCSRNFTARVYLEHIYVRLSQIYDIPFPQNLYILKEALQGYSMVFQHSKFFTIEQNQICVDQNGKVKVWINGDLSINYPKNLGQDSEGFGEEAMVERLVEIIADNTDTQSEPSLKFIDYFNKKKGLRGKSFEQAKKVVDNYARISNVLIPSVFSAVLDEESQKSLMEFRTQPKKSNVFSNNQTSVNIQKSFIIPQSSCSIPQRNRVFSHVLPEQHQKSHHLHHHNTNYGVQNTYHQPLTYNVVSSPQYFNISQGPFRQYNPPPTTHTHHSPPPSHFQVKPHYSQLEPINRRIVHHEMKKIDLIPITQRNEKASNFLGQSQVKIQNIESQQKVQENNLKQTKSKSTFKKKKPTFLLGSDSEEERDKVILELDKVNNRAKGNKGIRYTNIHKFKDEIQEETDQIAKSLPIDPAIAKTSDKRLTKVQNQRAVRSQITSQQMVSNLKLNELKGQQNSPLSSKREKYSLKYYSSLDNEIQVDPDIATDMAKYILQ